MPAPKKKEVVKPKQGVNPDEVGRRETSRVTVSPIPVGGFDGKVQAEIRQTLEHFEILQPYLTVEEVRKLGKYKWHRQFGTGPFTTVVGGRRFMLDDETFAACRDGGLLETT